MLRSSPWRHMHVTTVNAGCQTSGAVSRTRCRNATSAHFSLEGGELLKGSSRRILRGQQQQRQKRGHVGVMPWGQRQRRQQSAASATAAVVMSGEEQTSEAEREGWKKRQEESGGGGGGGIGEWKWTLNWNDISDDIIVGSCPRSAADVDRIAEESGATAILNLQSDICFDALSIPFPEIRERAIERGLYLARVPIRDFDRGDQTMMLPQAVRVLNLLIKGLGKRVYIHCTAGINRATLTAVAYLTFVKALPLEAAVSLVKERRSVAHPYIDCWKEVQRKLLDGRNEEVGALAVSIYQQRVSENLPGDSSTDWQQAQLKTISELFARYFEVDAPNLLVERDAYVPICAEKYEEERIEAKRREQEQEDELRRRLEAIEDKKRKCDDELHLMKREELIGRLAAMKVESEVLLLEHDVKEKAEMIKLNMLDMEELKRQLGDVPVESTY